ncbi:MAG: DUF3710 domain-containing protein [Nocardioidaceae bacterium]|nr:DUF3710 domain-containing protein [Nocardioidaceae bacterium]
MIFRRRPKKDDVTEESVEGVAGDADAAATADDETGVRPGVSRGRGPWDRSETTQDADDPAYVDLGGMVVRGAEGIELRLQVDEQAQTVASVLLAGPESGLELRAFAAPRHDGIWDEVRSDIAAEAVKRGGTATEQDGEYGTELNVVVPVQAPDGRQATQASRIVGVDGPRWMLRGTFLGKSAQGADLDGILETAFRAIIVVRGDAPMAPRSMLPLEMPAQTQPIGDSPDA